MRYNSHNMQPKLSLPPKTLLAFLALLFVCHEVHELAHTSVAYFQCDCWGQRDFNVWQICTSCSLSVKTVWASFAGPFITYLLIWVSWSLMNKQNTVAQQSIGFVLLWANVPFARLFTVLMKGGDEGVITRSILNQSTIPVAFWLLEIVVVLAMILPALIRAWGVLPPQKRTWVYTACLIVPMLAEYIN